MFIFAPGISGLSAQIGSMNGNPCPAAVPFKAQTCPSASNVRRCKSFRKGLQRSVPLSTVSGQASPRSARVTTEKPVVCAFRDGVMVHRPIGRRPNTGKSRI